jgi:hypothetical protein
VSIYAGGGGGAQRTPIPAPLPPAPAPCPAGAAPGLAPIEPAAQGPKYADTESSL